MVEGAKPRIVVQGLAYRCQTAAIDFSKSVSEGGDAYLMKHIIHDWDGERALAILRTIHKAMGTNRAKLLLLETLVPDRNEPDTKLADFELIMPVQ